MIRRWIEQPRCPIPGGRTFVAGPLRAIIANEAGRWHLSLSVQSGRYPTWDEIADARYDLAPPGVDMAVILPPLRDYVNVGNVFHLYEIDDEALPIERGDAMIRTYESGIAP